MKQTYEEFVKELKKKKDAHFQHNGTRFIIHTGTKLFNTAPCLIRKEEYDSLDALLDNVKLDGQTIKERYSDLAPLEGREKERTYEEFVQSFVEFRCAGFLYRGNEFSLFIDKKTKRNGLFGKKETITKYMVDETIEYGSLEELLDKARINGKRLDLVFEELEEWEL